MGNCSDVPAGRRGGGKAAAEANGTATINVWSGWTSCTQVDRIPSFANDVELSSIWVCRLEIIYPSLPVEHVDAAQTSSTAAQQVHRREAALSL